MAVIGIRAQSSMEDEELQTIRVKVFLKLSSAQYYLLLRSDSVCLKKNAQSNHCIAIQINFSVAMGFEFTFKHLFQILLQKGKVHNKLAIG